LERCEVVHWSKNLAKKEPTMEWRRPFRFGTGGYQAKSRHELIALAHKMEDLGYAVMATPDHFEPQLAPVPMLMTIADATDKLRIATSVFANDFRHPAVLAKEAATLDLLSGGRFELGIGAGYMGSDYALTGIPLDPPGVRIGRLAESVQIVKGLFGEAPVTFQGTYYHISGLEGYPKPLQHPHPPIMIAGGGKRLLSLAAREADIVGLVPKSNNGALDFTDLSPTVTEQRIAWIRQAAGDRFEQLELNTLLFGVVITHQRQAAAEELAQAFGATAELVLNSIHFLVGTVDQMVEDVRMWRERYGISYILVIQRFMDALAPVVARLAGT
jgi:probable F420-dependent oxidoreductase